MCDEILIAAVPFPPPEGGQGFSKHGKVVGIGFNFTAQVNKFMITLPYKKVTIKKKEKERKR